MVKIEKIEDPSAADHAASGSLDLFYFTRAAFFKVFLQ